MRSVSAQVSDAVAAEICVAISAIAAHGHLRCLVDQGEAWCVDTEAGSEEPAFARLPIEGTVEQVVIWNDTACARTAEGDVWCWGSDEEGRLGRGRDTWSDEPVSVVGFGT